MSSKKKFGPKKGEEEDNGIFFSPESTAFLLCEILGKPVPSLSFLVGTRETQEIPSGCNQGIGGEAMNCFNMKFTFKIDLTEPNTGGW